MTELHSASPTEGQDFEYDFKEKVVIQAAFKELQDDDARGYTYGLLSLAGSYLLLDRTTRFARSTKFLAGFFLGVTTYNLYTHKSRSYYAHLAARFNKKTSIALNQMMS